MDRRRFLLTSLAGAFAALLAAEAQAAGNVRRIGYLSSSSPQASKADVEEFRRGLRERGYIEGQNIQIEYRWAEGNSNRLPGLVASLARPGGNVTGLTSFGLDLTAKQLELLREALPDMKRLAVVWTPNNPLHPAAVRDLEELTRSRGIQMQSLKIVSPDEIEGAFHAAATGRAGAVWVVGDPMFMVHRARIAALAMDAQLPTSFFARIFVEAGGLMAYAPDFNRLHWQVASHVDKILKGAKAAELPIEDPTKFELVINLKTAKALGLTIPPSLLARADQVIE